MKYETIPGATAPVAPSSWNVLKREKRRAGSSVERCYFSFYTAEGLQAGLSGAAAPDYSV